MRRLTGVVLVAAALIGAGALVRVRAPAVPVPPSLPAWFMRDGDVVLRGGAGLWSATFARLNTRDRRFSHAGVVVNTPDGWQVLHAQADDFGRHGRVRLDSWADFAAAPALALLRADDPGVAARTARAAWAIHASDPAFDLDFDLSDASRVYCTELVWLALREALGADPLARKPLVRGRPAVLTDNLLHDVAELHLVGLRVSSGAGAPVVARRAASMHPNGSSGSR